MTTERARPTGARVRRPGGRVLGMTGLDRLTDEDVRILHLESGPIRGHTCKVVILSPRPGRGALSLKGLRGHVADRLPRFPRLRRRIAQTPLGLANPAWIEDAGFDVARHVVPYPAPAPLGEPALRGAVADLMARRLDRDRPLWRVDVVDRLEDGGAALVVRIHHSLADGMTAGRILSGVILDSEKPPERAAPAGSQPPPGAGAMIALDLLDRAGGLGGGVLRGARALASPGAWRGAAGTVRRLPGTVRRELIPRGGASPLDAPAGPARAVGFIAPPLAEVKAISKAFGKGVTVNDVVLATIGGGLRSWLHQGGAPVVELRAKVPVSLHHVGEDAESSANRDSFMLVDLGLEHADPVERLLAINAETQDRKRHYDAQEIDALLHDLGHVSRSLERLAKRWAMRPRVFAVNVSNVPGPRGDLSVQGAPVHAVHSLAEIANRHALRVSVFSAGGRLSFGLCADAGTIEDVAPITRGLEKELGALAARRGAGVGRPRVSDNTAKRPRRRYVGPWQGGPGGRPPSPSPITDERDEDRQA